MDRVEARIGELPTRTDVNALEADYRRRVTVRAHVFVSGLVQGVNFRWYTVQQARTRDVAGWVRNTPDGRVEAVFEGDEAAVHEMIRWCREGPRYARVANVDVAWEEPEGLSEFDLEL